MFPIQLPPMYVGGDPNEARAKNIEAMEAHLRRLRALAMAGQEFLVAVFGQTVAGQPARALADAWYDFNATEISDRIIELKAAPRIEPGAMYHPFAATPEMLVDLMTQRDRVDSQIENFETALEKIGDSVPGMAEVFKATALPMLESQRDGLNRQIEQMQQQLDEQNKMEAPKNESTMDPS